MAENTFEWTLLPGGGPPPPPPPEDPHLRRGIVAGRYELRRLLGKGGYGEVVEAHDRLTGELVAIKFLADAHGERLDAILREVTALRYLRLPGVVRLRDDGLDGSRYFMVMDRVVGDPFPGPPGARPWRALEGPALALLEILGRVHRAGVVHRDLKPANVLVGADGRPVVLDFGIAGGQPLSLTDDGRARGGTPLYLAPEQIRGQPTDARADLYAVGVMLFAALTGRFPHTGATHLDLMRERLRLPAQPLAQLEPDAPDEILDAVDALLAREPADRPPTALAALERLSGRRGGRDLDLLPAGLPRAAAPDADALRPLFRGPDLLHHLREDAATALWARTGGQPDAVADELGAWVRAGLTWRDGDLLVIERPALAQLEAGLAVGLGEAHLPEGLGADALTALAWARVAWPDADPTLLGALTGLSADRLGAALDELRGRALCWSLPDGRLGTRPGAPQPGMDEARLREAHLRLADALPRPSEARLRHLLRAGTAPSLLLPELSALARALLHQGRLSRALAVLEIGLPLARRAGAGSDDEDELLRLVALAALGQEDVAGLERALYDLGRATGGGAERDSLMVLLQGFRAAQRGEGARAMELLDALQPLDDEDLEIWRQGARAKAAARAGAGREALVLAELEPWAAAGTPLRAAKLAGWRANWMYRQGRYADAAALHRLSAAGKTSTDARLAAQINASQCAMYGLQLEEAARSAQRALELAVASRHPRYEALATWTLRSLAYRQRVPQRADPALVEAASHLGPYVEALFAMNEAAIAWRAADRGLAAALAQRAALAFQRHGRIDEAALCEALALAAVPPSDPTALPALAARLRALRDPELRVQALGLMALAAPIPDPAWRALALEAATCRPVSEWPVVLDILSFDEALGRAPTGD